MKLTPPRSLSLFLSLSFSLFLRTRAIEAVREGVASSLVAGQAAIEKEFGLKDATKLVENILSIMEAKQPNKLTVREEKVEREKPAREFALRVFKAADRNGDGTYSS